MPLTPADIHNVAFKKPSLGKRGYDEDEVDSFLDLVEKDFADLIEENNTLKGRVASGGGGNGDGRAAAELAAARDENSRLQSRLNDLERALSQGKDQTQQQLVAVQQQLQQTEQQLAQNRQQLQQAQAQAQQLQAQLEQSRSQGGGPSTGEHHGQAVQVLALAQQTADQHLAQAKAEADRLLGEARVNAEQALAASKSQAERQLAEAQARAEQVHRDSSVRAAQTLQEAEQRASTITGQLEERRAALEMRVEQLRTFEREYRTRLKSYLESQLRDLEATYKAEPAEHAAHR